MVSSIDPHNMCAKVERITAKTGCTSCTNWTVSFKVQGFQTKTHLLQRHFIFLSLFRLKTFFASNMQHSKPHTEIPTLQKLRGLRQKLDALRVQTGPSLSKYKGFRRKLICYKDISFFLSLFQLKTFFASKTCNIQSHILKFQPFLTSFDIFHAFHDLFSA